MKKRILFILLVVIVGSFSACKSEFEKVRTSGDSDLLYKKAFEYYEAEEYLKAQTLFELIISSLRGKVEAEKVYFYYAYSHYKLKKYLLSAYYFKNFSNTFSNSPLREEADFMAAFSNYELSPSFRLDQTYTEKAIEEFQTFVNTYPTSNRVERSNLLIDEMRRKLEVKALYQADLYFDLRQYQAATQSYENMLKSFPETTNAERIRYKMAKAAFLLAENSIYEKKEERFIQARKYAAAFLKRYPDNKDADEVTNYLNTSDKQIKIVSK